jgi:hydrogenase maturation protease
MASAGEEGGSAGPRTGRVAVLGLGNVLMQDDALGPHAICLLESRYDLPDEVSLLDLGTPGFDLHPHLERLEAAIVVDTVRAEGPPGEIRLYRRDEVLRHAPGQRLSPHDPGLKEALLALEFVQRGPSELLLVGVIPGATGNEVGLTPAVRESLSAVEDAVLDELRRLGFPGRPAARPRKPNLWWEDGPTAGR